MIARAAAKREVLRVIAAHDGEWYWYQVDRAVSGGPSGYVGPFSTEIDALAAGGLIEVRPTPDLPGCVRYWLTDAGRIAVAEQSHAEPGNAADGGARLISQGVGSLRPHRLLRLVVRR